MRSEADQQLQQRLQSYFEKQLASRFDAKERAQVRALLEIYYRHVAAEDLEEIAVVDLVGAVVAHWQLLRTRPAGEACVRVYNPTFEEHGWQSSHTVIETVSDDMSFLVDSLSMGLNRAGVTIHLTIHPVLGALRDGRGRLEAVQEMLDGKGRAESMICFQIEKQPTAEALDSLGLMVRNVLRDITLTNRDWSSMRQRVSEVSHALSAVQSNVDGEATTEYQALLDWALADHFTFLAFCTFDLDRGKSGQQLVIDESSRLGLFRPESGYDPRTIVPVLSDRYTGFPCPLVVTKANTKSTVHRPAHMDYIGVKRYNAAGEVDGLHCIVGFFTLGAYSSPPSAIPLLRTKVQEVVSASRLAPGSFSGKVLQTILQTFPRDDLFQIPTQKLTEIAFGILGLQERQRTRLFLFRDVFNRFFSVLIYLPKETYNRELRLQMQQVLVEVLQGIGFEFSTLFTESILARVHYIIRTAPDTEVVFDTALLEQRIVEVTKTWQDGLREALQERYGEAETARLIKRYEHAFPGGYREEFVPRTAAADITRIEEARQSGSLGMHFYRHITDSESRVHFRLYSLGQPVPLSEAIPILENMGLSVFGEQPYRINDASGEVWIHDFSMRYGQNVETSSDEIGGRFQTAFRRVWEGEVDSDGFNQLILGAALSWRQVVILRAYSKYLQQIKTPYSQSYIIRTLALNPQVARLMVELFEYRFDPDRERTEKFLTDLLSRIETLLDSVASLDEDRILRSFVNLFMATLRTNYFQQDADGQPKPYLSFKIDPSLVSNMPLPRPMYEIFVFSVRMAGVYLRGGKVARGGLRWSDRLEDFRTEVLGLMKAQMVKNTVIVPVGSKGGFIAKRLPANGSREETTAEVVACYKTLLYGMLDLTDNLVDGAVVRPAALVTYDEDDPYLVIAADKGTATFSDIANGVAAEYGFWLGDAFASGGSLGYDHKRMGITARGAWESVKRNFRELGIDIQKEDFRVVGIGDMSGDVFGNGMLLSRHIRLVGAFNHQHIFLDPEPDAELSFEERARLFALARSSWSDYNKKLLSKGGGIFSRHLKSIPLSAEVRSMLGVKQERLTPNEVISALLKSQVDLLWNGGIGTYVKAESESQESVGDKTNEGVRINGNQLRCKVVGEGGNLGLTQLGRVEYASKGGLIYTDAIDNSAGVDCSDHEVNIKILLGQVLAGGEMTFKQRNRLLAQMTDEVAELVLAHNYTQTQSVSLVAWKAPEKLYEHARFIDHLEQRGRLNRTLEYLPDSKAIAERQANQRGLTKPEIAVLHAYSKMNYYDALIASDIPDDPYLRAETADYFPRVLVERFPEEISVHRLLREITATYLTNRIVDHMGPGFGFRVREEVGADIASLTRAFVSVSKIFDIDRLWRDIEALDNRISAGTQIEMMHMVITLLRRTITWLLRHRPNELEIVAVIDYFRQEVGDLAALMPKPLSAPDRLALQRRVKALTQAGVEQDLARRVGVLTSMASALDLVEVARECQREILQVASVYFHLGTELEFHWLREQIEQLHIHTHWHDLARTRLRDMLDNHQREIAAHILRTTRSYRSPRKMIDQWREANLVAIQRHTDILAEFKARSSVDFAMLSMVVAGAETLRAV